MNAVQITFGKEMTYAMPICQEGMSTTMTKETVRANQQPEVPKCKEGDPYMVAKKTGGWNATRPKAAHKSK